MLSNLLNNVNKYSLLQSAIFCLLVLSALIFEGGRAASASTSDDSVSEATRYIEQSQGGGFQGEVRTLKVGEAVRREMVGGAADAYSVALEKGQYLRLLVEQLSIDVEMEIYGPDNKLLIEMDSPSRFRGPESASVVAGAAGDFKVKVISDKSAPQGSYEIKIEALREPTAADLNRVAAERALVDGQTLRWKGTEESRKLAVEKYKEALSYWKPLGDVRWEAYTLCNMGRAFKSSRNLQSAVEHFNQAIALLQETHDSGGQAYVLNEMAAAYRDLGQPEKALEIYDQALALRRKDGDRWGEAQLLNNAGIIYTGTGYQHKALEKYNDALLLWRTVGDRYMETYTLNNLAGALDEMGELMQASGHLQQVLKFCADVKFCHEVGNRDLEILANNNLGKIYDAWADSQTALAHYTTALEISRRLNNRRGEALVLNNMGMVYAGLGDTQRALEYLNDSLKIRQELNIPVDKAVALTNIGYVHALEGNYRESIKYIESARPASQQAGNRLFIAYGLTGLGMAHVSLGELPKALEYYKQALTIQQELGDRRGQAVSLDKIGQASALMGDPAIALENYNRALQNWAAIGDRQGQALTLYGIASLERDRNNLVEARNKIEEAIAIVESLRTRLTSQQLRLNYFATKQNYYELAIDVRMRQFERQRTEEDRAAALYASERARARSLLDLLSEARADIRRGADPNLLERARRLELELNTRAASLMHLRNLKRTGDAEAVEKRLAALTDEYDALQAQIRARSKSYADLKQPQPLTLKEIQGRLLDDDTLLLEYALGERRSYLWLVSRTSVDSYTLGGRAEIEKAAGNLRESLTAYEERRTDETASEYLERLRQAKAQYPQQATELSRLILGPAASKLKARRLVIVADGALQYIPFEALPVSDSSASNVARTGSQSLAGKKDGDPAPLILKHEITYLPSISTLALLRNTPRRPASKAVAVLADPVFDTNDERVAVAQRRQRPEALGLSNSVGLGRALRDVGIGEQLARLRYTLKEADKIIEAVPSGAGMKAVSFNASKQRAMSAELGQYRVVHFATHAILGDKHPELSGIVLSLVNEQGQAQDGFLRLHDIYNLSLPVDLVVLSACRTGIGKEVKGEGLIGLTRGFMYAGASSVIASLWKVEDEATAELMSRFYRHLLRDNMSAPAALRTAQIEMMQAGGQWKSPYHWAGFVLQGDWK